MTKKELVKRVLDEKGYIPFSEILDYYKDKQQVPDYLMEACLNFPMYDEKWYPRYSGRKSKANVEYN